MNKYKFQNTKLKNYRRANRNNSTETEKLLWKHLRRKQLMGYRFQRQYSIDNYILDFYCPAKRLAIELDGSQHAEEEIKQYDQVRSIHLGAYEIKVLRFWNSEVKRQLRNVLDTISRELEHPYTSNQ